jgi:pSer/pThr/pTyr-binding forkhead associated (FHA) protein
VQAFLVNDGERMAFPVRRRTTSIGRDAASHIVLRDPAVSRFHADVRAEAGEHVLYSMGSAGTTVNGVRVSGPQLLEEGDQVGVGSAVLRYTRGPVGSQVHVELGGGELDTVASVRPTLVMQEAVTAEMPDRDRAARPAADAGVRDPRGAAGGGGGVRGVRGVGASSGWRLGAGV